MKAAVIRAQPELRPNCRSGFTIVHTRDSLAREMSAKP
jgi:hypothetical protein